MNALHIALPLALAWLAIVLGHRHHRREAANRHTFERHLRSVGPMPERWVEMWEREGRA